MKKQFISTQFSQLGENNAALLEQNFQPFVLDADEILYREGMFTGGIYFLEEGSARENFSDSPEDLSPMEPLTKHPGDWMGESTLLGLRSPTTAVALEPVKGWMLTRQTFRQLMDDNPDTAIAFSSIVLPRTFHDYDAVTRRLLFHHHRHAAVMKVSQALNSPLSLDDILREIWTAAIQHTGAEKCTIYLVDEDSGDLRTRVMQDEQIDEIRIPIGQGIAGDVAITGATVNLEDAYTDKRFDYSFDKLTGFLTRSLLTMPLRNPEGKIIGIIQLLNKNTGRFTRDDEAFIRDISVHASLAIQRAQKGAEFTRQQSLAALGNFAAALVHDLKNPIDLIRGKTQALALTHKDREIQEFSRVIVGQIDRLMAMTQEVLDFSRGSASLMLESYPLNDFFTNRMVVLRELIQRYPVHIRTSLKLGDTHAMFDHDRIGRVLENLILNASEAMPDGGDIRIEAGADSREWWFSIRDTGIGIPRDKLAFIFDPFVTHGKTRRSGLGLAIVKRVVEAHRGVVSIESKQGDGTLFTVKLPLQPSN